MNDRDKILKIMEMEKLNAKEFADQVGVQAGTLSNIINGRNNPSLDVMKRILNRFRTLSSDWLILDVGSMYRPSGVIADNSLFDLRPEIPQYSTPEPVEQPLDDNDNFTDLTIVPEKSVVEDKPTPVIPIEIDKKDAQLTVKSTERHIDRIVVFYTDGTYEAR